VLFTLLKVGDKAPDFNLEDIEGNEVKLSEFEGKKIIIYFYPKDNTPGCTKEACSIRDVYKEIKEFNTVVLGISPDNIKSHIKFAEKFKLPFKILSDNEKVVANKYGVWVEKKIFGKIGYGIKRTTFVVNEKGIIIKIYDKVKPENHGKDLLKDLKVCLPNQ
jgi:peroxiredoxin Q/BCP